MLIRTKLIGRALCLTLGAAFTGCSGGGTVLGTSPLESESGGHAASAQSSRRAAGNVTFSIGIPPQQTTRLVTSHHGFATTRSIRIATETGTAVTLDLSPQAPACAPNPRVPAASLCTARLDAPAGNHVFSVTAYDAAGARGNILSKNSTRTIDVKPAGVTNVALVLQGTVRYAIVMLTKTDPTVYVAAAIDIDAVLEDADQNLIVGAAPYDFPVTLTTSDSTNGSLTKKVLVSPADAATSKANYDGANVAGITFSAAATDLPAANVTSALLVPSPPLVDSGLVYVANETANTVTAYTTGASGDARPTIVLAGKDTQITSPIGLAHDSQGHLYVACLKQSSIGNAGGEILVFAPHASGDATPIRSWQTNLYHTTRNPGPAFPTSIAVDASGYTYVGMAPSYFGATSSGVEVFDSRARGLASPVRVFAPGSQAYPQVAVNAAGQVYVLEGTDRFNPGGFGKYAAFADGNSYLSGPLSELDGFDQVGGVAVAPSSGNVFAVNITYPPTITVFDPALNGVIGQLAGTNTGLGFGTSGIAFDAAGRMYIGTADGFLANSIEIFSGTASGNAVPSRVIGGPDTGLSDPVAITIIR